jgi:hypothetical protein
LDEERLAIQTQYNEKLASAANATVVNISSYLNKLETSSGSPLSPKAQLALAEQKFDAVAKKAKSGDFNSLGDVTDFSDQLLSASRAVNGSGTAYVTDFNKVLDTLSSLTNVTPDQLTASEFNIGTQTQTAALQESLDLVKAELIAIKTQLRQNGTAPSQIAA